jgi:hypothetical protein
MVLTPRFRLTQDQDYVLLSISLPYIRVSTAENVVDGCEFSFFCKPYLLKLTFPYELDENEELNKAVYDPNVEHGTLSVSLKKKTRGQHFPDLDMTTHLLQQMNRKKSKGPAIQKSDPSAMSASLSGIQVIDAVTFTKESNKEEKQAAEEEEKENDNEEEGVDEDEDEDEGEGEDGDYEKEEAKYLEQEFGGVEDTVDDIDESLHIGAANTFYYGFNCKYSKVLANLREELYEMMEIAEPDSMPYIQRRTNRIRSENAAFDAQR